MIRRVRACLAYAALAVAASGCAATRLSGAAGLFAPHPAATPVPQTTGTITAASGTFLLPPSNGYVGAIVFAPSAVPAGVTLALAATAAGAPAPSALAVWELRFAGEAGTATFDGFPTVTLALLTAANVAVELFDGSEPGAPPVVLLPQAQVNGFVTFVAQAPAAPTYFLLAHAYWIELVAGSAPASPAPPASPVPAPAGQESP